MGTPHKHAELIKAWADGAEIEVLLKSDGQWTKISDPNWSTDYEYRIKPEPDYVRFLGFQDKDRVCSGISSVDYSIIDHWSHKIKITFDGETGALKSAEVLK